MNKKQFFSLMGVCLVAYSGLIQADPKYPERPVNLVVSFPAGGGTDATMRAFAKAFQEVTGQPMTVENKPGGGSMIALGYLKTKQPDGYTLGTMTTAPFTQYWLNGGKGVVHPLNDFDYLAGTHGSVFGLLARDDAPFNNLEELVNYAKKNPDKNLNFGSIGLGGAHHLAALEVTKISGIKSQHVTYKGEAEVATALMGGHIDLGTISGSFVPFVESKKLKVIGLATAERLPKYPKWKTYREQGFDVVLSTQVGIGAPKGVSPEITRRIEKIVEEVTKNPEFIATVQKLHQPIQFLNHESYRKVAAEQFEQGKDSVQKHGLKIQ